MTKYDRILRYIPKLAAVLLHCSTMTLSMRHRGTARIRYLMCLASEVFRIEICSEKSIPFETGFIIER